MVDLAFHQVLFLSTLTRHYGILIVFLCLHHRLIQFLIDFPFLYLLFLCGTLCPQLFRLHLQLLPLSPMLLLICINSVSLYLRLIGEALELACILLFGIHICLTLSCIKIWI